MRVLVLTTWFPDTGNQATAPFNLKHVQAIADDHDVRVVHVRLGGTGAVVSENYGGVPVTRISISPLRPLGYLALARHVWAALKEADVLHTMAFTSAVVAAPIHAFRRTPWVHTEHWSGMADPASVSKLWVALSWLRYILKLPNVVTAVSTAQAKQLSRFARGGRVDVVPNVISVSKEKINRTAPANGVTRLISVGGLVLGKRPLLAVQTLALLRNQGIDASLTWVGDGPLRANMVAAAAAAGVTDHLSVTGWVEPQRVQQELRKADVFFLPTSHETFCVAAAEAVAAGLPAVVTDLPAVRDFLTAENSVLVGNDSAQDFGAGVELALRRFANVSGETIAATIPSAFAPVLVVEEFTRVYARAGALSL
ncbi:glycosyltransferase [Arthrobacter sp. TWP1-1]|uniref:glycosyltransferase n=1 Tax=Arthrobacter sp. TWP1-1 TaxID=2804568 RepID=UPI003CF2BE4C